MLTSLPEQVFFLNRTTYCNSMAMFYNSCRTPALHAHRQSKEESPSGSSTSRWLRWPPCVCRTARRCVDNSIVNVALPTLARDRMRESRVCSGSSTRTRSTSRACCSPAGYLGDRFRSPADAAAPASVDSQSSRCWPPPRGPRPIGRGRTADWGFRRRCAHRRRWPIITAIFTKSSERAAAVGIMGRTSGVSVAVGPVSVWLSALLLAVGVLGDMCRWPS